MNKKFISIIWWYHKQIFSFDKKQNYHMLPIDAMQEELFECEIFAIDSQVKIEDDPNFIVGTKVIYYKGFFDYLIYLFENRNAIIYSNSLTIKTLLVWIIWKKTVFYPHSFPFWHSFIKNLIINFFYKFFTKIRINNKDEALKIEEIKKWLSYICPLSISDWFLSKKNTNRKDWIWIWNITDIKNPEFLIETAKKLKKQKVNFKISIIWEDRYDKWWKNFWDLVKENNLENYIVLLWVLAYSEIKNKLSKSLIYINTSISEGQCLAVYEWALSWNILCLQNILAFPSVFWEKAFYHNIPDDLYKNIIKILKSFEYNYSLVEENQKMILEKYNYDYIKTETKKMFLSI